MATQTIASALNQALHQEMAADERVIIMGEDVGRDGGVFRITDKLIDVYGEERVIDTPLAEAGILGTAIGLAMAGMRPVVEMQFDGFVYPAFDQLISHAARMRNRSRGMLSCPLVLRFPYGGGVRALEHHSEAMEALYMHIPGIKVVTPATPYDAKGLLISAIRDPDPVVFMEPKRLYRSLKEDVPEESYTVELGKARVMVEGKDVTVVSWGSMIPTALKVQGALAAEGVSVEVIDLRSITPLDREAVTQSVTKTGRCVILQEGPRTGGVAAEISALINENCLFSLQAPVERVTGFDIIMPLLKGEDLYIPEERRLTAGIRKVLG
ncbi:alpha-ketoacid dehydrogenase subunit beta [Candidatus Peregrinibacteria bacterium CG_4_9_14_0_2_um_filter_53_11]|nr:MAG: alpha-ketoacid dehydrogenase subunit beta [Candidatus Peregrinibacteria bacterium CG_4_9_14_0_2_um_filter_53_11]